jgi:hypothetical protein
MGEELDNWKKLMLNKHRSNDNLLFSTFTYWHLQDVSCVPIYRNQEWFNNIAKPTLTEFWNNVLKYRKLGLETLKSDIQNKRLEKKREKEETKKSSKKVSKISSESSKKQKQIKDFINLDDVDLNNSTNNYNTKSRSASSSTTNSSYDYNEDDDITLLSGKSFFSNNDNNITEEKPAVKLSWFS